MRLIDADAAIDALNEQIEQCNKALGSFDILPKDEYAIKVERASLKAYKEQLENMPSAEPYTTTHDSIPAETGKNDGDRTSGDCISRRQAIYIASGYCHPANIATELAKLPSVQPEQHLDEWCVDCKEYDKEKHSCPRWNRVIRQTLLDVQPERKTGHWILNRSGAYCCDKCMEPCASYAMMKPRDKFCKMCGSRNEVME